MEKPPSTDVTALLNAWSRGDEEARDRLVPLIYKELRRLAENHLRRERANHTLQPTALVNEAWIRLSNGATWESRKHFFSVAARLMRGLLVDYARTRNRLKRGGKLKFVTLDEAIGLEDAKEVEMVALDDALKGLEKFEPRKCRIVELHYFGGLTVEEIAALLDLSPATIKREFRAAKAWLYREIKRGG